MTVGVDVGNYPLTAVARRPDGAFAGPWAIANQEEIPQLVAVLRQLGQQHPLTVALEPSETYSHPLRQALGDAGIAVRRVSPKAAHDYAEVFDGVPSQHDHKDAAVVAELAALGKAWPWPYVARVERQRLQRYAEQAGATAGGAVHSAASACAGHRAAGVAGARACGGRADRVRALGGSG